MVNDDNFNIRPNRTDPNRGVDHSPFDPPLYTPLPQLERSRLWRANLSTVLNFYLK